MKYLRDIAIWPTQTMPQIDSITKLKVIQFLSNSFCVTDFFCGELDKIIETNDVVKLIIDTELNQCDCHDDFIVDEILRTCRVIDVYKYDSLPVDQRAMYIFELVYTTILSAAERHGWRLAVGLQKLHDYVSEKGITHTGFINKYKYKKLALSGIVTSIFFEFDLNQIRYYLVYESATSAPIKKLFLTEPPMDAPFVGRRFKVVTDGQNRIVIKDTTLDKKYTISIKDDL